jgi:hypothetical protein
VVSGGGAAIVGRGGLALMEASGRLSWIVIANNEGILSGTVQAIAYCAGAGDAVAASTNTAAHERAVRQADRLVAEFKAKR